MKEIYKNPLLYYVLVPVLLILWPVSAWLVYVPKVEKRLKDTETRYKNMQGVVDSILAIDPGRLEAADGNKAAEVQFDYVTAVNRIANSNSIPTTSYSITSQFPRVSKGQKSQGAKMNIKDIDIARFAKFMSDIQLRWANLQCDKVNLTKQEGVVDSWKAEVDFEYYY